MIGYFEHELTVLPGCADADGLLFPGQSIQEGGKGFFHPQGRTSAMDISSQTEKLFGFDHLNTFFSDCSGSFF